MLPAISPAVISHLAMPNSGVHRYAAALQSLVSAGARDRVARAEEPVVRRLCAGGSKIRTLGPPWGRRMYGTRSDVSRIRTPGDRACWRNRGPRDNGVDGGLRNEQGPFVGYNVGRSAARPIQ